MSGKLTPRVGDRVLVKHHGLIHRSTTGEVVGTVYIGDEEWYRVRLDDGHRPDQTDWWSIEPSMLTVVDRDPVELPEGWGRSSIRLNAVTAPDGDYRPAMSRECLDRIRGPEGDYVAEHWDELMGDS